MNPDAFAFLARRQSVPSRLLAEPAPDADEWARLLALAVRVPDHGRLAPFRFIRIVERARDALGEAAAAIALRRQPDIDAAALDKDRGRFNRAPLVVVVVAHVLIGHKIPESEQRMSAGLAAYNLLLGAEALGYGAQWLTGWPAYDPGIADALGLATNESIVGFIHIGTATERLPDRARPDSGALVRDFAG